MDVDINDVRAMRKAAYQSSVLDIGTPWSVVRVVPEATSTVFRARSLTFFVFVRLDNRDAMAEDG